MEKRRMTASERKNIEEALEEWWREFEQKLIAHIPDDEKYLYISSKSCFELSSNKVLVDKNGVITFYYREKGGDSYEGHIYDGRVIKMRKTEKIYRLVFACSKKYLESYLDKNEIIATVMGRNEGCCSLFCKEKTIEGLGELKNLIIVIADDTESCDTFNRIFTKE